MRKDKIVLVDHHFGLYSFPKGKLSAGESIIDAAYREIREECGLRKCDIHYVSELPPYQRADGKTGRPKKIYLYLFTTKKKQLAPRDPKHDNACWATIDEAIKLLSHREDAAYLCRTLECFAPHYKGVGKCAGTLEEAINAYYHSPRASPKRLF